MGRTLLFPLATVHIVQGKAVCKMFCTLGAGITLYKALYLAHVSGIIICCWICDFQLDLVSYKPVEA